ncbi:hypothetical protein [Roseomonas fluvialis]|uniref:Uncharacterized protein n=1 Tax=Roseomonas fluvialis TaxID=1750527 RepID=A0ABN6NYH2_9PROT|nr:hypothetical protein [Roseomonas fluvialis]BDG71469.1 hypothetical protein Rmf_13980 [Roseomonas fluvialis]
MRRNPDNPHALQLRALVRARLGDAVGSAADAADARARLPTITAILEQIFPTGRAAP